MAEVLSNTDICNLALSHLGNYGTVTNIDTPTNEKETICARWYDITRRFLLKSLIPNFAIERRFIAQLPASEADPFGYATAYAYPNDCLKVLGVDELYQKQPTTYAVRGNKIFTDQTYDAGLPLRFVKNETVVANFSPEFIIALSWKLAENIALPITQDINKRTIIQQALPGVLLEASGINAQENKPIRISRSKAMEARYYQQSRDPIKR